MLTQKRNLILLISLLLIGGFLITSLASYYVSRASLRSQINETALPLTSDNIYSKIQQDLLRPIFISSLMANDTFVRDWVLQGEKDPRQIKRYLKEIQGEYDTFTSFFVSDRTRTYYHADGILKKVSPEEERDTWYFRIRGMDDAYEINVDPDLANHDTMTIFINYKVYDYVGNFIGATGVGLKVDAVKNLIEEYQRAFNRTIFFVNRKGEVALHGSGFDARQRHLQKLQGISDLAEEILAGGDKTFQFQRNGKTVHLNTRYIPEFNWFLLVEQAENGAIESIFHALLTNLLICVLVVVVVLVLTNSAISTYQRRLETVATTDKLTGVYNRLAFELIFEKTLRDVERSGRPLSVLLLDIDHFKGINDNHGHLAGDRVLKQVADLTTGQIRKADTLARWGGDEFLVLFRDNPLASAVETAEKIRTLVAEQLEQPAVTISLGLAEYRAGDLGDNLLARADRALYDAKKSGRNRVVHEATT